MILIDDLIFTRNWKITTALTLQGLRSAVAIKATCSGGEKLMEMYQQAPINYCPGPEASEMRSNERVYFHLCLEITHSVFTLLPQQCLTDTTWPHFPSSTLAAEHSPPNERLFICNSIIRTSNEL